ncbi:DUF1015 family protein [Sedimentibacter sp.]|uniref:DUF1015 domain-containing protein n=1 Tax=Sedimentibacter sp. TaxID=1960295 RepID=UPI000EE7AF57|nr:DUF1015 family protein [Sedimentibacter sp.]HCX61267.1 DUF1015 domain-containing protein [Clostridiales bacterium]
MIIKAFNGIRPIPELADKIAALPYDVMNSQEARIIVNDNPYSFLHVDKAEIDLDPSVDIYNHRVYEKARDNLNCMIEKGWLKKDGKKCFYIYKQVMGEHEQTGLVCCLSVDDYLNDRIKKHEHTRNDKELDRINHVMYCNANTGPIFLMHEAHEQIDTIKDEYMKKNQPVYDFASEDNIRHIIWVIDDGETIEKLTLLFKEIDNIYIADGHHRAASAVKAALKKREETPDFTGNEEYNFFLGVLFPHDELKIMDYNRIVKDLNEHSVEEFIDRVKERFTVEVHNGKGQYKPDRKHKIGMFLLNKWYILTPINGTFDENDTENNLDVSILQNNLLSPVLGIKNPRTDERIDFVGGVRGLGELEKRVSEGMAAAFSLYPTSVDDLMDIANQGKVMPPKSTWFEPKLRSGLFIHSLK